MNKRFLGAILTVVCIIFSASFLAAQKRQVMIDRVVAIVGGSAILHSDVTMFAEQIVQSRRAQGFTSDRDPMNESLEALMKQKLLFHQSQIDSIESGNVDELVSQRIDAMVAEVGSVAKLEEEQHMKIFNLRQIMYNRMTEQQAATAMQNHVIGDVTVTPGEVNLFFSKLKEEQIPLIPEQYVYAQITRFPASMKEAKQRTKERLLDMRERIITGQTSFSVLARMYSVDGSAIYGGEMQPAPSSMYVRPFAEALEKLKPGQVSEIVETEFGFHIIELIDKKGELYHCRHIVLRPTYTREELMQPAHQLDSIARLIRLDSLKFEDAALRYSDDASSKMNGGIVSNHDVLARQGVYDGARLTATRFLKEDFGLEGGKALEDYNALMRLKVGEISDSFQTTDFTGNQLSKIVKLVEIIPAHVASLEDDYVRLEEMALNQKRERIFREWLDTKIESMYIYIDPEYRDWEFVNRKWIK